MFGGFPGVKKHNTSTMQDIPGHCYLEQDPLGGYNWWMYVKATAAVTATNMVIMETAEEAVTNITGSGTSGSRETGVYPYVEDSGETWTINEHKGSFLYVHGNTGAGGFKRIVSNTATRVYYRALYPNMGEEDAFSTAVDTTSDITILSPWHVKTAADADQQVVIGQAPFAFTSGYYGYIRVAAPPQIILVKSGGSFTIGEYAIATDDTAGQLAAASDADNETMCAIALHAGAADQLSPFLLLPG